MNTISAVIDKLRIICKLIISTPRFGLIIVLQFVSGMFSFAGLPMLIPVLNYMKDGVVSTGKDGGFAFVGAGLIFFGLEPNFYTILTIASVLILTGQSLVFFSSIIAVNSQTDIMERYSKNIFNAYSRAGWLWLVDSRSGEMNHAVIKEAELASVAHLNAQRVFIYFVQVVILLVIVLKLSWFITLSALGVYGIISVLSVWNSNYVLKLADGYNEKYKYLSNDLYELQQNKKFFKTSLLNEKLIEGIFTHIDDIKKNTKKQNVRIQGQLLGGLLIAYTFLIILIGFHRQLSLSYSVLLLVLLIFAKLAPQFSALSAAYTALDGNIPMYKSLCDRMKILRDNEEKNGNKKFDSDSVIRFENVCFSYPDGSKVFDKINIAVEPHKTTAFIGSSGVGKSTLLDLILGLLKPSSGTIYYGNILHDELDKNSLRSKVAYVGQETTLVDGTMKENLTIRVSGVSDEKIKEIVAKVGLDDVIREMSVGIETYVGENGIKLSGGQRQRVALARALFTDPKILILDEATSSLDSESEQMIQKTIKNLQKDFTIIIVTHKLSAVRSADKIYVLEEGKVCESGSYEELLDKKGKLYHFDSLQK